MTTQSSSKQEKFQICPNFDGSSSWVIIKIMGETFKIEAGPYLSKDEALTDLGNLICEQE